MRTHVRVVVVGGGIMGCGLLYHLAKEGWTDSVLIEKNELTSGSTWHAAGLVGHAISNYTLGKINGYASRLYPKLEAETGQSVTWHGCGGLRIAYTDDEVDWLKYILSIGRGLGNAMEIIGPSEIKKVHPFYNLDGVKAALHTLDDGHVDPAGACQALAKGARQMGAEIVRFNRVTDIKPLPSGEWQVITEQGNIVCEHVVNAGGTYARQIGKWVGLNLPIVNMTHHYLITDTVPEFLTLAKELPVVRDDSLVSGYIRMEQKSGMIGIYEKTNPNTVWDDGTPWEAEHELFDPDYERIGPWLENAMGRMPIFAKLGIKRAVHGAITHPPDGNMLLGPAPGLRNFWCACGAQIGIAWGPGSGKYLAQWIVHGTSEINMREFDPRRYGPFANRKYQLTKSKEDYLLRHEIPFPAFNRLAGRPVKTSTLYERLKKAGAIFEEAYGWERPRWFARDGIPQKDFHSFRRTRWFEAVAEECKAIHERAGIMDLSAFGKIEVAGPDAESFVNRIIANRAPRKLGGIVLSHILNNQGTIEAESVVARVGNDRFYFTFATFFEQRVRDWLSRQKQPRENVTIRNVSEDFGCLVLSGPKSRDVLRQVTQAPLDDKGFPWLSHRDIVIGGAAVRALRISYVGELGWEMHVPMPDMPKVYEALWAAGRPLGMENFGSYTLNAMRMEKAFKGASELTNEVTLMEGDVERFLKLDKGDFIGREATLRRMKEPLRWKCVYLEIEAHDAECSGGEAVLHEGRAVGSVSSGGYGHRTKKSLAFAYVDPRLTAPGTNFEVVILADRRPARVLPEPVYDPNNEKPRGIG